MKHRYFPSGLSLAAILIAVACSSDDGPRLPQPASLLFPENLSECTTGVDLGGTTSRVTFEWEEAANTFDYELTVQNLDDPRDSQTFDTENTTQSVVLRKSAGYRWSVISRNEDGTQAAESDEWMFINAGSLTSFPPFPATLISPESGARIATPPSGQVLLRWSASDLDNDIALIEVFAGTDPEPELFGSLSAGNTELSFPISASLRFYWRIRVTDQAGNRSLSPVRDFFVE